MFTKFRSHSFYHLWVILTHMNVLPGAIFLFIVNNVEISMTSLFWWWVSTFLQNIIVFELWVKKTKEKEKMNKTPSATPHSLYTKYILPYLGIGMVVHPAMQVFCIQILKTLRFWLHTCHFIAYTSIPTSSFRWKLLLQNFVIPQNYVYNIRVVNFYDIFSCMMAVSPTAIVTARNITFWILPVIVEKTLSDHTLWGIAQKT